MKKNYSCPSSEWMTITSHGMCQAVSKFGELNMGGGVSNIDPETGGI